MRKGLGDPNLLLLMRDDGELVLSTLCGAFHYFVQGPLCRAKSSFRHPVC
jgi:hypothetical protein